MNNISKKKYLNLVLLIFITFYLLYEAKHIIVKNSLLILSMIVILNICYMKKQITNNIKFLSTSFCIAGIVSLGILSRYNDIFLLITWFCFSLVLILEIKKGSD